MKNFKNILIVVALGLSSQYSVAAGHRYLSEDTVEKSEDSEGGFRLGVGITESLASVEISSTHTTLELGYDYDDMLGASLKYSFPDDSNAPDRMTIAAEFGYTFGDEYKVKPYLSGGFLHKRGNFSGVKVAGNTGWALGMGVRASYKFLYANAGVDYFPENSSNSTRNGEEEFIWIWNGHTAISFTAGVKF